MIQRALNIKRSVHGNRNLAVATAEEDLSYALYVLEYSSGNFDSAKEHICKSIEILRSILPMDHLLLSSARRVKALILEEIALDHVVFADENPRKLYSRDRVISAIFGLWNIQICCLHFHTFNINRLCSLTT